MRIKSFRGNSLVELDKEVNSFLREWETARVINFVATNSGGSVSKLIYIYIVEYDYDKEMDNKATECIDDYFKKQGIL